MAVQLRTTNLLTMSGAVLDCIAFGVPTITTEAIKADTNGPSYIASVPDRFSPLLIAELIADNSTRRRDCLEEIGRERLRYLADYSPERYASSLLQAIAVPNSQCDEQN